MGAHHYDIAQWALKMDQSGPVEIIPPQDPEAKRGVRFLFENGVEMVHGGPSGCVFHGENGTLHIDRGRLKSDPEEIVKTPLGENEVHLPKSPGHHRNWLDCVKSREAPIAEVEKGARTAAIIHLGNLALESIVDHIEDCEPSNLSIDYDKDLTWCEIQTAESGVTIVVKPDSLQIISRKEISPKNLLNAFLRVQQDFIATMNLTGIPFLAQ